MRVGIWGIGCGLLAHHDHRGRRRCLRRIAGHVTHPGNIEVVDQALSLEDLRQLAQMGAFIEHTAIITMPGPYDHDPAETAELIKAIGAQHCILSTDLGPKLTPPPVEGMKLFISSLLGLGITPDEIELMVKINPAKLLGLDS